MFERSFVYVLSKIYFSALNIFAWSLRHKYDVIYFDFGVKHSDEGTKTEQLRKKVVTNILMKKKI